MTIVARTQSDEPHSSALNEEVSSGGLQNLQTDLTRFVQSTVSGATLIEERGLELHYRLPLLQAQPRTLARLFSQLEEQKERLGVMSYGISSCTMEEVSAAFITQPLTTTLTDIHEADRTRIR